MLSWLLRGTAAVLWPGVGRIPALALARSAVECLAFDSWGGTGTVLAAVALSFILGLSTGCCCCGVGLTGFNVWEQGARYLGEVRDRDACRR